MGEVKVVVITWSDELFGVADGGEEELLPPADAELLPLDDWAKVPGVESNAAAAVNSGSSLISKIDAFLSCLRNNDPKVVGSACNADRVLSGSL